MTFSSFRSTGESLSVECAFPLVDSAAGEPGSTPTAAAGVFPLKRPLTFQASVLGTRPGPHFPKAWHSNLQRRDDEAGSRSMECVEAEPCSEHRVRGRGLRAPPLSSTGRRAPPRAFGVPAGPRRPPERESPSLSPGVISGPFELCDMCFIPTFLSPS